MTFVAFFFWATILAYVQISNKHVYFPRLKLLNYRRYTNKKHENTEMRKKYLYGCSFGGANAFKGATSIISIFYNIIMATSIFPIIYFFSGCASSQVEIGQNTSRTFQKLQRSLFQRSRTLQIPLNRHSASSL